MEAADSHQTPTSPPSLSVTQTMSKEGQHQTSFACAACLGSLGLFGNSLLQLSAISVLARQCGLQLAVPAHWTYGTWFEQRQQWKVLPMHEAFSLPIITDRTVLSHPGFKAWLPTTATYQQLAASLGVPTLSGRQLRQNLPQVCGTDLQLLLPQATKSPNHTAAQGTQTTQGTHVSCTAPSHAGPASAVDHNTGSSCSPALDTRLAISKGSNTLQEDHQDASPDDAVGALRRKLAGHGLWGWFQYNTSLLQPHEPMIREATALRDDLQAALEQELQAALQTVQAWRAANTARPSGAAAAASGGIPHLVGLHEDQTCDFAASLSEAAQPEPDTVRQVEPGAALPNAQPADANRPCQVQPPRRGRLVVCHVRLGDFVTGHATTTVQAAPALSTSVPMRTEPPFEDGQGQAWGNPAWECFVPPVAWYWTALASPQVQYDPSVDVLWVCSDDGAVAADPWGHFLKGGPFEHAAVYSWASFLAQQDSSKVTLEVQAGTERNPLPGTVRQQQQPLLQSPQPDSSGESIQHAQAESTAVAYVSSMAPHSSDRHSRAMPAAHEQAFDACTHPAALASNQGTGSTGIRRGDVDPKIGQVNDHVEAAVACSQSPVPTTHPGSFTTMRSKPMLADWFTLSRADVLLAANSTFSFTAAMLGPSTPHSKSSGSVVNHQQGASDINLEGGLQGRVGSCVGQRARVHIRPVPWLRGFAEFDPWHDLPNLLPKNHSRHTTYEQ